MARLARHHSNEAWRETVTRHMPETWQAARLALQARITALDSSQIQDLDSGQIQDEAILDLTQDEAA